MLLLMKKRKFRSYANSTIYLMVKIRGWNRQRLQDMILPQTLSHNTILSQYCDMLSTAMSYIVIFFTLFNCKSISQNKTLELSISPHYIKFFVYSSHLNNLFIFCIFITLPDSEHLALGPDRYIGLPILSADISLLQICRYISIICICYLKYM